MVVCFLVYCLGSGGQLLIVEAVERGEVSSMQPPCLDCVSKMALFLFLFLFFLMPMLLVIMVEGLQMDMLIKFAQPGEFIELRLSDRLSDDKITIGSGRRGSRGFLLTSSLKHLRTLQVNVDGHTYLLAIAKPTSAQVELLAHIRRRNRPIYRLVKAMLMDLENDRIRPPRFLSRSIRLLFDDLPMPIRALINTTLNCFDRSALERLLVPVMEDDVPSPRGLAGSRTRRQVTNQSTYFQALGRGKYDVLKVEYYERDYISVIMDLESISQLPLLE